MPSFSFYTLGYAQWTIEQVETQRQVLNALLIDVRHSPYTSKPGFSKAELETRFTQRYRHVPSFGNLNYKDGPIELACPEQGVQTVQTLDGPLLLMCGCQSPEHCHRSTVAALLQQRFGGSITHLRSPRERVQPDLFSDDPSS